MNSLNSMSSGEGIGAGSAMNFFQRLFSPDFMPHGYCYMWDPRIVGLHVISDGLIAVAYYCIPIILIYFIRKNRSLPFNKIFWMFGIFILACGTTHVMEIWNIWHATYFIAGLLKAGTAAVSVLTAVMLIPLVPQAMVLPNLVRSQQEELILRLRAETALQENLLIAEKARADLADNRELLRLLLDAVKDYAIYTLDAAGNVTSWNAGAALIEGYGEAEILGTHFSCFFTSADRASGKPSRNLQQSLAQGRYEELGQRIRKDGSSYWANIVISPIYDNVGKHKGFTKIARDVTERKVAADEALREQAEILDLAQVMVRDTKGRIDVWSGGAGKLYGYTREEAVGRISHELLHTQFPEPLEQIEEHLERDGTWGGELVHRTRDGRLVITASVWVLHRVGHGKPSLVVESNADITVRKQTEQRLAKKTQELISAQESLEAQTQELQTVLDSMTEGLATVDAEGKFVIWNAGAAKLLGLGATTLPAQAWAGHYGFFKNDTVTPFPADQMPVLRALRGEVTRTELFVRNDRIPEGIYIEVYGNPMFDKAGAICGGVAAFRDITQLKEDERQIRKLNEDLERRVAERTTQLNTVTAEVSDQQFALDQHAIVAMTDVRGTITYVNDKFCTISQYSKDELLGENHRILNSGHHPKKFFQQMYHTIANGKVWHEQVKNRAKDGSFYWVDTTIVPTADEEGKPVRYIAIRADITDRKRAEDALKESLAQSELASRELAVLKFALDEHAIVAMTDVQGTITYVNDKFCTISQYSKDELLGQNHRILNSGHHPKEFFQQMYHTIANGKVWHDQVKNRARDGSFYWVDTTIVPTADEEGKPVRYIAIRADITDRKRAEDALKESLAQSELASRELAVLKFALDQHAIVAMTDVHGTITYVNDKFCTISQYSKDELLGQNHRILNSGHHPKDFFQEMYGTIAHGNVWRAEIRNRAKDGSIYWVDTTIVPTLSAEGKPRQYVAIRADVTERKRAEEDLVKLHLEAEARNLKLEEQTVELERTRDEMEHRVKMRTEDLARANETLETSNIELQQFAYVASHDLQSPLRSISGFVQLLKMDYEEKLDDQARDYIRRTVQSIAQMQTLIRDLLSYSRVDARSRPFVPVPLVDVFHGSVSLLESSIRDAGAQVTCDELPVVLGDSSQLAQLMQNLIGNGLKYHGTEPPHVHVSAQPGVKNNEWIVSVRDNGIGIDPKYFTRIFEIFKRLHDQKEYPGTGIGLAVCRRVVERHGGAIWVESEPGHGSTFRFSIPADAANSTVKTETADETND
jgi:PAS domain S-box-containing protein